MLPKYRYSVVNSAIVDFKDALDEIIKSVVNKRCVRLIFFSKIESNEDYHQKMEMLHKAVAENFEAITPAYSLVAQPPFEYSVVCEICELCDDRFEIVDRDYGVLVVGGDSYKEIVAGSINSDYLNLSIEEQCKDLFEKAEKILTLEQCKVENIVRQWNYIEHITLVTNEKQNYQVLNDARSKFYAAGDWSKIGYPAATGIGTHGGGVMIDFNAIVKSDNAVAVALDNPLQIAAHVYSEKVLLGESEQKTTPKFERAKAMVAKDEPLLIYVSGTAAIRGEASLDIDATEQTRITMENIAYLVSVENQKKYGVEFTSEVKYQNLRVYIKCPEDFEAVKVEMERITDDCSLTYLYSDVCRDELLVEVEGIAN